jgi:metal-responsive CopG/Arc/MetJ family transcriptional regulator
MFYHSLDEAIFGEGMKSRQELVEKLAKRFVTDSRMEDDQLIELANQYRTEHNNLYVDRIIANDPVDW